MCVCVKVPTKYYVLGKGLSSLKRFIFIYNSKLKVALFTQSKLMSKFINLSLRNAHLLLRVCVCVRSQQSGNFQLASLTVKPKVVVRYTTHNKSERR